MKRPVMLMICAVVIGGCNYLQEQKVETHRQWRQARARIIYGVGCEHLKVGDLDKARSSAMETLSLNENYLPARILLAKVCLGQGRCAEAAEELRKAKLAAPADAEIPYLLGEALERTGRYAEALKCYQEARALDPSNDTYVTASAEVLVSMDRPKQALELLEARMSRTSGEPPMLVLAGEVAMLAGSFDKAAWFFQRCLDARPKSLSVREGLARAQFFAGQYGQCLESLKTIEAHPNHHDKTGWVYVMMGDSYMATNRPREAKAAYQTASNVEPSDPVVWLSLAKANLALREVRSASAAAYQALDMSSRSDAPDREKLRLEASVVLAQAMLLSDRPRGAMEVLAAAARKNPNDPTLWCMLGRCYSARGLSRRALACYMAALRSDPDHRLARNLLAVSGDAAGRSDLKTVGPEDR